MDAWRGHRSPTRGPYKLFPRHQLLSNLKLKKESDDTVTAHSSKFFSNHNVSKMAPEIVEFTLVPLKALTTFDSQVPQSNFTHEDQIYCQILYKTRTGHSLVPEYSKIWTVNLINGEDYERQTVDPVVHSTDNKLFTKENLVTARV